MNTIKVAIIEDHNLIRVGIRSSLNEQKNIQVVGDADTGAAGLELLQHTKPDIAIIDIGLPDINGIALVHQFRQSTPPEAEQQTKIIILTSSTKEQMVLAAFAAGADSYCVKTIRFELLLEALYVTYEGYSWIDPLIARIVLNHACQSKMMKPSATPTVTISGIDLEHANIIEADPLTNREMQVLELIVQGHTNNQISHKLFISVGTVKMYVRGILNKLCASDRTQAAVLALRAGLLG